MTQTIDDTLTERGSRYGEFNEHASVTQAIKVAMSLGNNWLCLDDDMKEALEMVAHKVGRILNGDPDYIDSWTDIIGYARLVEKRLIAEQAEPKLQWRPEQFLEDEECPCIICAAERKVQRVAGIPSPEAKRQDTQEEVSILDLYDRLNKAVAQRENSVEPSSEEIEAAVKVLLAAGVISYTDEDGDA